MNADRVTGEFRAIQPHGEFAVLMAAGRPPQTRDRRLGVATPSLRHEAIVGLARAVFALGGQLIVTGDPDVAPAVAAVALDYATLPTAERSARPVTPLAVVESDGEDPTLRALLTPYVLHDAVQYVNREGDPVDLDFDHQRLEPDIAAEYGRPWRDADLREGRRRHRLRPWIIERFPVRGAVFISVNEEAEGDIEMVASRGLPVVVLTSTVVDGQSAERWAWRDPTREMMARATDRWSERDDRPRDRRIEPVPPYAFLLQRLVAEWAGRPRRPRRDPG